MLEDCPNLFMMCGPNLYAFSSAFVMIEAQVNFIVAAIRSNATEPRATIAVAKSAHQDYNRAVQLALKKTVWNSGCSSYFIDSNGNNSTNRNSSMRPKDLRMF
jgi:cation diffusion facilitator CzcD-associated flavoprotein CzcO